MSYKQLINKISQTLGISYNSVCTATSEYKTTGTVTSPNKKCSKKCLFDKIDDLDRNALRQKVHGFWLRKEKEESRTIYYFDETWVNAGDCVEKLWVNKTNSVKTRRL